MTFNFFYSRVKIAGQNNGKFYLLDHLGRVPLSAATDEPKKDEPKKDEPKKDEPKKDEPKKDEPKKDEPKKDEPAEPEKDDRG